MSRKRTQRFSIGAALLLLPYVLLGNASAQTTTADPRQKDRDAIASVMQSFAKSFEARDAKQLAALWTSEGEFENARGLEVHGHEELEQAFTALFAKTPELSAKLSFESVRFLSTDTAIEDGTVTIQRGPTQPTTEADYTALLVRDGGNWLLARLSESTSDEALIEDLAWLIGEWTTASGNPVVIRISYTWDANKKFIHVKFSRTEQELTLTGAQVIGIDPATQQFRSWVFEADGGTGEAQWTRDGDSWTLNATGTLADGRTIVETNVLRRIDDDTITYQSIGRSLDDTPLPDLPPMRITRVKPEQ